MFVIRNAILGLSGFLLAFAAAGVLAGPTSDWSGHAARPALRFSADRDFATWQDVLRAELEEILRIPRGPAIPLEATKRAVEGTSTYAMERIEFSAEPGERIPGYVLVPNDPTRTKPWPVMICLQGHAPGMHISIGRATSEKERKLIAGGRDLALQAVAQGWAAVVIEQRGFGERARDEVSCQNRALQDLLKGRPLTGQRVLDVVRTIDFIETRDDLDETRIACIGNSTGGTVSFYAACVETRIRLAVVSCSFGTFEATWLYKQHCACGYLPGLLEVADMPDLAGLITPRDLIIVAGRSDYLARFDGVEAGFKTAQAAYAQAGVRDRAQLVAVDGGHQFFPDQAWPRINAVRARWDQE